MKQPGPSTARRSRLRRAAVAAGGLLLAAAGLLVTLRLLPLPQRLSERPSTVVRYQDGSVAHVVLAPDGRLRVAVRPGDVDEAYVRALLRYEDARFLHHPGVDPLALLRAAWLNLRHGQVVSGGSTLTMQLVRVLEPRPRTLRSKLAEAVRAATLEAQLSKDEILGAYLSFAPYGRNVEGVEAASFAYFGHGARHLNEAEIATLLAVPQRPAARAPSPANTERLRAARDAIAVRLVGQGALGDPSRAEETLAAVRHADVPTGLLAVPREVSHATAWLTRLHPGRTDLKTTLDRGAQRVLEKQLALRRAEFAADGIHDAAAVIVEHGTGDVRALAGNFDFFGERPGSQVLGFDVPRSPGSALKPFVHALAVDAGLALPDQLMVDIPVVHGSYAPDNYTGTFAGLVPLREALAWSLNVPFVELLAELGVERFTGALRSAGVRGLKADPGRYGLSAAVGGVEVTPLEVALLYGALAGGGSARDLRVLADDPPSRPRPFLSKGAAWLTRQVLTERDRPDFPLRRQLSGAPRNVHWKTGTSQGHLDAWACGSGPTLTAVVWLGNFDRAPSKGLVGADAAAPLLFDVLEGLEPRGRRAFIDAPPEGLATVELCAWSGHVPSAACPERRLSRAVRAHVPTTACPYHAVVDVDLDTGLALNPSCRAGRNFQPRTFTVYPSPLRAFLAARGRSVPQPPSLAPDCEVVGRRKPPAFVSPAAGQSIVLMPGVPAERQQVPLLAANAAPGARHAWFLDGAFLGTEAPEDPLWWTPVAGRHELVVVDEAGLTARRALEVLARLP